MITSKLSGKGRTPIPECVRDAPSLQAGDRLDDSIEGNCVMLTNASHKDAVDPFAVFAEWSSGADERAYADL